VDPLVYIVMIFIFQAIDLDVDQLFGEPLDTVHSLNGVRVRSRFGVFVPVGRLLSVPFGYVAKVFPSFFSLFIL
jgi:hypothetical protein